MCLCLDEAFMVGTARPWLGATLAAAVAIAALACGVSSRVSREIGARCEALDECDERCLEGRRYPGGFCSVSCDSDGDCPLDSACADLEGGVCLFECRDTADCEFLGDGWTCRSEPARGDAGGQVMMCAGPS